MKKSAVKFLPYLCLCLLIVFAKSAAAGAKVGIALCFNVVIPSLFPFLLLTKIILHSGENIQCKPLAKLFRLSEDGAPLLMVSILGGFPVGAYSIEQLQKEKRISKADAAGLLGYCNFAGPAFLFGIAPILSNNPGYGILLWAIQLVATCITARFIGPVFIKPGSNQPQKHDSIKDVILSMAVISVWIIVTQTIISVLKSTLYSQLSPTLCSILSSCLEITTGISEIARCSSDSAKLISASALLSFGGFCVWLQIINVTPSIPKGYFCLGTLCKASLSAAIASAVAMMLYCECRTGCFIGAAVFGIISIWLIMIIRRKSSGNLRQDSV